MEQTINLKIGYESDDLDRLQTILGVEAKSKDVAELVAEVGAREALDQAIGKVTPMTMSEQRQYRVRSILEKVDIEQAELVVSALFKLPSSSAKRLIETTAARFDIELRGSIEKAAQKALQDKRVTWLKKDNAWEVPVSSTLVRKWMKEQVGRGSQRHPRASEREAFFFLPDGAYEYLCKVLGIKRMPIPK